MGYKPLVIRRIPVTPETDQVFPFSRVKPTEILAAVHAEHGMSWHVWQDARNVRRLIITEMDDGWQPRVYIRVLPSDALSLAFPASTTDDERHAWAKWFMDHWRDRQPFITPEKTAAERKRAEISATRVRQRLMKGQPENWPTTNQLTAITMPDLNEPDTVKLPYLFAAFVSRQMKPCELKQRDGHYYMLGGQETKWQIVAEVKFGDGDHPWVDITRTWLPSSYLRSDRRWMSQLMDEGLRLFRHNWTYRQVSSLLATVTTGG